jgi:hypothetical protein
MITALTVFLWEKSSENWSEETKAKAVLLTFLSYLLAVTQDITLILFLHALAA